MNLLHGDRLIWYIVAIPIDEESQPMTALIWEGRQYQFTRFPQKYHKNPVTAPNFLTQNIQAFQENQHIHKPAFPVLMTYLFMVITWKNRLESQHS